jgi:pimeloyl-ACP methyl ester carboxylesterase
MVHDAGFTNSFVAISWLVASRAVSVASWVSCRVTKANFLDASPLALYRQVLVLVAADDEAIPPDAERLFASRMGATTVEVASSHVAMVSHPDEVAQLIKTAAEAVPAASPPD